ncbi:MAG: hypothetical protein FJX23_10585 [Alphaproteobacteria bacterium]|nr:hypothetical protein [Alphaproteobacteria bacterium]
MNKHAHSFAQDYSAQSPMAQALAENPDAIALSPQPSEAPALKAVAGSTAAPIILKSPVKLEDTVLLMLVGMFLLLFGASLLPYGEGGQFLGWLFLSFGFIAAGYALCKGGAQRLVAYINQRMELRDKRYTTQAYIGAILGLMLGILLPPLIPALVVMGASLAVRNAKKLDIMTSEQAAKAKNIWGN